MEHADCAAVQRAQEAAQLCVFEVQGRVFAPGNLRIGLPERNQLPVVPQDRGAVLFPVCHRGELGLVVVASHRILYRIIVSPEHGQPPVCVGVGSAPGAPQADFLTVVDEGRSGHQDIQVRRHMHTAAGYGQESRRPVCVMVCNKRNVHRLRIDGMDVIQIGLGGLHKPVHVSAQGGFRDQALHHGRGEMEAVEGFQVTVRNGIPIPDLRHGIDIRIDLLQFIHVPYPELGILFMFAVVGIFRSVKPEAVHAQIQPVGCNVQHCLPYLLIVEVQFRHLVRKISLHLQRQAAHIPEAPAGGRRFLGRHPGIEVVEGIVDIPCLVRFPEIDEPLVVFARVVQRQVQDQFHSPLMAQGNQFLQVLLRAESRINLIIIGHVVFMIGRRGENRRQPDSLYSQALA